MGDLPYLRKAGGPKKIGLSCIFSGGRSGVAGGRVFLFPSSKANRDQKIQIIKDLNAEISVIL